MDAERIKKEALPRIEEALGHRARTTSSSDEFFQFRVSADEAVGASTGMFRRLIREALYKAGAGDVKVVALPSLLAPESRTVYLATALPEKAAFLAGR